MKDFSSLSKLGLLLLLALLVGSACLLPSSKLSAPDLPPGWQESSLEYGGLTRWYRVYTPDPLPEKPALVLYLHGGTLSMRSLLSPLAQGPVTWPGIAAEQGLVLLVPNGVNPETGDTYGNDQNWNDLRQDQAEGQTEVDDVGFLLALLDRVVQELGVDEQRIFVTGASNGGMMTQRLLIEAPERFSAGASFIANLAAGEEPLPAPIRPTPLLIANGTEDPLVPWEGGMVGRNRGEVLSTAATVDYWVRANQVDPDLVQSSYLPDLDPGDGCRIQVDYYPAGDQGAPVLVYSLIGGGHTLPTRADPDWFQRVSSWLLGPVCRDAEGVSLAWDFFRSVGTGP